MGDTVSSGTSAAIIGIRHFRQFNARDPSQQFSRLVLTLLGIGQVTGVMIRYRGLFATTPASSSLFCREVADQSRG